MSLNIVKSSKYLKKELLLKVCGEVFSYIGEEFEVNIKFACKNCIQELNKKYLGKDKPTNVLSFNHEKDVKSGDIIICESVVEIEANKLNYRPEEITILYVVHGMLHLAGFDHKKDKDRVKMELIECSILKKLGIEIER